MKYEINLDTYTTFLIANGNRYSGVEMAKALKEKSHAPAHDSISRWLLEQTFEPKDLWSHVQSHVNLQSSLIVDDSTLDKRWSPNNELVDFHWSGNVHKVTRGISLVNLLAAHTDDCIPVDYRVYEGKKGGTDKNEHFRTMLDVAKKRRFEPPYVMADSWYSSLENMKKIVKLGWKFILGIKENRLVNEIQGQYVSVSSLDWTQKRVRKVWLKGFGFVLAARIVFKNGDVRYVCTNDLSLTQYEDLSLQSKKRWTIEEFHRGIKQTTGIEKCYSIKKRSQLTHIFACFVAFVKLEFERLKTGVSWYEQKAQAVRLGISRAFA
jgi:putative transposase